MEVDWREDEEEETGKSEQRACKVVSLSVISGASAHDYYELGSCSFFNLRDTNGQTLTSRLIKSGSRHVSGVQQNNGGADEINKASVILSRRGLRGKALEESEVRSRMQGENHRLRALRLLPPPHEFNGSAFLR